jgi:hypothetical protein
MKSWNIGDMVAHPQGHKVGSLIEFDPARDRYRVFWRPDPRNPRDKGKRTWIATKFLKSAD